MEFEKRTFPNHHTHPVFLSTIGALLGLDIKPIHNCKVIELNCGDGGNIIPLSYYYPQMNYVGVDADEAALTKARKLKKDLNLNQIRFLNPEKESLAELEGQFDFIILNRLYSWIEPSQRKAVWEFCQTHLSDNGIVYINFNSLPGWAELLTLRKLVKYRLSQHEDLESAILEIQKFLPAFSKFVAPPENVSNFSGFFKDEVFQILSLINSDRKQIFLEDFFGHENHPVYLSQLLEEASNFGFKFLSNCDLANSDRADLPGNVLQLLQNKSRDQNEFEQYIDFFVNQTFREILLCKSSIQVNQNPDVKKLEQFWVSARFAIEANQEKNESNDELLLISDSGSSVKVKGAMLGGVVSILLENDGSYIRIGELLKKLDELQEKDNDSSESRVELIRFLLSLYVNTDLLDMKIWEIPEADSRNDTFSISPLIQIQARQESLVTSREHFSVSLLHFEKRLLQELPLNFTKTEIIKTISDLLENEVKFRKDIQTNFGYDGMDEILGTKIIEKLTRKGLIQKQEI